jgi:hypothetical protein
MKILKFIKWSWNKTDAWTRWWLLACGLFGASLGDGNKITSHYLLEGSMVVFAGMLSVGLYNMAKASYTKFEKEYDGLFEVIKDSDK